MNPINLLIVFSEVVPALFIARSAPAVDFEKKASRKSTRPCIQTTVHRQYLLLLHEQFLELLDFGLEAGEFLDLLFQFGILLLQFLDGGEGDP